MTMPSTGESELLRALLGQRIMVLEGPKGTMLQAHDLREADYRGSRFADHPVDLRNNNEVLTLVQPDLVRDVHLAFARAGADIVATNTFNGNALSQREFATDHLVPEMNRKAAGLAREAAAQASRELGRAVFVAGTMGPTPRTASLSPDVSRPDYRNVTFNELRDAYGEQARALIEGGVDLLLLETTFDTLNARAGIYGIEEVMRDASRKVPLIVSVTFSDKSGRTLSGQTLEAFVASVEHAPLLAIGINCGLGAAEMRTHVQELSELTHCMTACYPNAGLPNAMGGYDQSPQEMGRLIGDFAANGWVNLVGGCCGSTPAHIAAIAQAVRAHAPRVLPARGTATRLAGLDALTIGPTSNFIMVGERTNVSGSKRFARLIRDAKYEAAAEVARDQVQGGANILDVNMDEGMLDSAAAMVRFLRIVGSDPEIARVPVMLDSSDWSVIVAGLQNAQGKCVVNSISLKDGEETFIARASEARRHGAAVIVMAFDEDGQAETCARKVAICRRAYSLLVERVGFPPQDVIFDVNVLAIGTGMPEHAAYAVEFLAAVRELKRQYPLSKCSGGISNLSFSFRGNERVREAIHAVFLYHAIHAGLDMGIVNAGQLARYDDVEPELRELVEDLVLNRRPDATERLLAYSEKAAPPSTQTHTEKAFDDRSVDERLASSVIKGLATTLDAEVEEALALHGSPLAVIEGPLMGAMGVVGDLFADGRMFLPQVVKSARTMKQAVARLSPLMEKAAATAPKDQGPGTGRSRMVLATVKGDVHDIGKNIVSVVLGCNGHQIIDLGVMVPAGAILDAAIEHRADMVGLSGLITPSLTEMVHVAQEMERRGMTVPLLIGGATTSKTHTAVKIAPAYSGPVVHVADASRAGQVVRDLLDEEGRAAYVEQVRGEQQELRDRFAEKRRERALVTLDEARSRRYRAEFGPDSVASPEFVGVCGRQNVGVSDLAPWIDWTPYLHVWDIRGRYPELLSDPTQSARVRELVADATTILEELAARPDVRPLGVYGFFAAHADGDDVVLTDPATGGERDAVLHFLRQQVDKGERGLCYCLSDFVAPAGYGDHVGLFAVTSGPGIHALAARARAEGDDYRAIVIEALADRLAEAFAEFLHKQARDACGFGKLEDLTPDEVLRERYRGIRPAPGYPACPDHLEKRTIFRVLGVEASTGIELTEAMAMSPPSSVCGYYIMHPDARYFPVGMIDRDQVQDYARRTRRDVRLVERWLEPFLAYDA